MSEGGITTTFTPSKEDPFETMALDGNYSFNIYVKNDAFKEKNNVLVKINVPKELTLVNSDYSKIKYDERTRELILDIGTLKTRYDVYKDGFPGEIDENKRSFQKIILTFRLNKDANVKSVIKLKADTYYDVKKKADESRILQYSLKDVLDIGVLVNSNIGNGNVLLDTDKLEYISEVTNKSNNVQRILIVNKLPNSVNVDKFFIKKGNDNEVEYNSSNSAIYAEDDVKPGEKIRLRIATKPTYLGSVESTMPVEDSVDIYVNSNKYGTYSVNNIIKGTSNRYSENFKKLGEKYKASNNDSGYKYNLTGSVWNDDNLNGIKDYDEVNVSGLNVYLYNENGKDLILDEKGNPIVTKTDKDGNYSFSNLKSGNYIVMIDYNSNKYNLTKYKSNFELNSSNFIDKEINGKKYAVTDVLKIDKSSLYNIDLGLVSNIKFSLKLMQGINQVKIGNRILSKKDFENYMRVNLKKNEVKGSKAYIEYNIIVKNNGLIPGYAKSIVDYLPEGFEFELGLNNGWYIGNDNYLYNNTLANTLLNPGESKEIKLILSYKISNKFLKLTHNVAEIANSISVDGVSDNNSESFNKNEDEDDFSYSDVYFANSNIIINIFKVMLLIIEIGVVSFINFIIIKKYKEGGKNEDKV